MGLTTGSTLVAGECKFTNSPVGYDLLKSLEEDVEEIRWAPTSAEVDYEYCLFSRSAYRQSVLEAEDERDDPRLFTGADVVEALSDGE